MKFLNLALISICLFACQVGEETAFDTNAKASSSGGRATVYFNDMDFQISVICREFIHESFLFKSELGAQPDTTSDRIELEGYQRKNKLALDLTVNGEHYSSANLGIKKNGNTASGAGKLFGSGDSARSHDVSYKVTCK